VHDSEPLLHIVGERVALGPLLAEHAPAVARWQSDYGTMRTYEYLPGPHRIAQLHDHGFDPSSLLLDPAGAAFAVYITATQEMIGLAGLAHIDHINRTGEIFIMIGEPRHRGQGFGTEATRLVLDHAFLALGLSNVVLRVFAYNVAGIRAYEKAGFQRMGVRRKSKLMGGRLWDTVYMEALADEFESPVLGRILVPDEPKEPLGTN
jgi:RimJ/RimL family protein N-acetyltransferase